MTVMRHSRKCLATFVRILISFTLSQLSLEMVLFMSHICRIVQSRNFLAMCLRTSAKGWRRVRDICDDLATVLR